MKSISLTKALGIGGMICAGGLASWYFLQPTSDDAVLIEDDAKNQKKTHLYPVFTADGESLAKDESGTSSKGGEKRVATALATRPQDEAGENEEVWEGEDDTNFFMPSQPLREVEVPQAMEALIARLNRIKNLSRADRDLLQNKFRKWAAEDGEAALITALRAFPRGDMRLDAAMASIRGWAAVDMTAAADYVASLHTPQQDYLVYNTAADYGQKDGQSAVRWALKSVPIEYRNGAAQHAMLSWAGGDTEGAINWLEDYVANEMRGGRAEKTMVWEAVFSYSSDSLEGARNFVESLPQVDAMEAGVHAVVDRWMDQDRIAAGKWIQEMEGRYPDLPLDDVYQLYAMQEAEVDPQNALQWAQSIKDERKRTQAVEMVQYKIEQNPVSSK